MPVRRPVWERVAMKVLEYAGLDTARVRAAYTKELLAKHEFDKWCAAT